jgi:predicted NBD/HSP70 family sugar kinase
LFIAETNLGGEPRENQAINLPTGIKDINQLRVLTALREQPGLSRAAIARQTGLGKATISTMVADFIDRGLIHEVGPDVQQAMLGRRPVRLELNGAAYYAIGIELTGNECIAVLTDLRGNPLRVLRDSMPVTSVEYSLEIAARSVNELIRGHDRAKLLGVGVGIPGTVDSVLQRVILAENLGWVDIPFGALLAERIGLTVLLVNRTNAGATGEFWHGNGMGVGSLFYVSIGVGIGAGIIIGGVPYEGANGSAGEIGHVTVDPNGRRCKCGNTGCLETLASTSAIVMRAKERIGEGECSLLADWSNHDLERITGKMVADAATAGDSLATSVIQEAGGYLGIALANVINLLNPALIVVDGDLLVLGDVFLTPVRQAVERRAFTIPASAVDIVPSALQHQAAAIGAASVVIDRSFAAGHRLFG